MPSKVSLLTLIFSTNNKESAEKIMLENYSKVWILKHRKWIAKEYHNDGYWPSYEKCQKLCYIQFAYYGFRWTFTL
jgi:hypothetical protein